MESTQRNIDHLTALIDRLRPVNADDGTEAESNIRREVALLKTRPAAARQLGEDLMELLALPNQTAFYGETGIRSALGFWLELTQRVGQHILPETPDTRKLRDIVLLLFHQKDDYEWVNAVSDEVWLALAEVLELPASTESCTAATQCVLEAVRATSYRIAGVALDRELLRADPSLEQYESPFLAQNAALLPILERLCKDGSGPREEEVRDIDVMLDQCSTTIDRVRRKAGENGISIRLTYLLARLRQLIDRLRTLLDLGEADTELRAVRLMKELLTAEQTRHQIWHFIGENLSLVARNVTDHASRHGEHYIAESRAAWWAMARSAAGGGIVIALMAMLKIKLSLLHLPPLTEGIAFGLNYGLGFTLIHLLGFSVATKQPAMTAAAIAATLEEAHPRKLEQLGDLAQNVVRTQFIAVIGNVALAFPVAVLIAFFWPSLFGTTIAPPEKVAQMLTDVHPFHSGALFFAAVAGLGLFLSGLVSGYFDNQARYHQLSPRIAAAFLSRLGPQRSVRLGEYFDAHYGAVLGNLFFGMYLGLVGVISNLTGLPIDIRHVAFSSANLGTVLATADHNLILQGLPWAVAGVIAIALVNLVVSFTLALYVAMKSRRQGTIQIARLTVLLLKRFSRHPLAFIAPPKS